MKILFLSDNFPPEGNAPANRTWEHAKRWARAGHQVTVITCVPNFPEGQIFKGYKNRWRQIELLEQVRVVRVKTYISANQGTVRRILDYVSFMASSTLFSLFEEKPDIIVATSPQFFTSLAGFFVSTLRRVPWIFEVRDLWPASIVAVGAMKPSWVITRLEDLELYLYDKADGIVTVTNSFKVDLVRRGVSDQKINVVFNGADDQLVPLPRDELLKERLGLKGKFVVAYIGTHGMAHSLTTVIDAAYELKYEQQIAFLFVGSGAAREQVEARVSELGLSNVLLLPRQDRTEIPKLWSISDLGLIPLANNPVFSTVIPSKMFEIAALDVPILMAIPEGEATCLMTESGAGIAIEPENPTKMAEAIRLVHSDADLRETLKRNGRTLANRFSRQQLADLMLGVLRSVAEGEQGSGPRTVGLD